MDERLGRGIYGDLMIPGIACGIMKFLLIFNTNTGSPPDTSYVVDPKQFNVQVDTAVILALSLCESLQPCSNKDILASINLIKNILKAGTDLAKHIFPFCFTLMIKGLQYKRKQPVLLH